MENFKQGDELKIKDSCKKELLISYETRSGMSGVSPKDIDKAFIFIDREGSNIRASLKGSKFKIYSLNNSRFETV